MIISFVFARNNDANYNTNYILHHLYHNLRSEVKDCSRILSTVEQ